MYALCAFFSGREDLHRKRFQRIADVFLGACQLSRFFARKIPSEMNSGSSWNRVGEFRV